MKRINLYFTAFFFITSCLSIATAGENIEKKPLEQRYRIVVKDITTLDVPQAQGKIVTLALESYILNKTSYEVLNSAKVKELLKVLKIKSSKKKSVIDEVKTGEMLDCDFVMIGIVSREKDKYNITVKTISVEEEKILFLYIESFSSIRKLDSTVEKIATNVIDDIKKYKKDKSDYFLTAKFHYLHPVGFFSSVVNPSYGFTIEGSINNILINNLSFIAEIGCFNFINNDNSFDNLIFAPVSINMTYEIDFFKIVKVSPIIGAGFAFMRKDGPEYGVEFLAKAGAFFCLTFDSKYGPKVGLEYNFVIEGPRVVQFLSIYVGVSRKV